MQQLEQLELQIETMIDRIKKLKEEKDFVKREANSLKSKLDEMELQYMQLEEDCEKNNKKHNEEIESYKEDKERMQNRIAGILESIKTAMNQSNTDELQ